MNPILVVLAHPALHRSHINKTLFQATQSLEGVTFRDLYELYPDFDINVSIEQEILNAHSAIVFQHPFYWYSCPSLLKEWMDRVLTYGWAYGENGTALHGKALMSAISAGGAANAYHPEGQNRYTINQFLVPFEQTANLCGMAYIEPFIFFSSNRATQQDIQLHAQSYASRLCALRDGAPLPLFSGTKR